MKKRKPKTPGQTALWQDDAPSKVEKKKTARQRVKTVTKKATEVGKAIVGKIARGIYSSTSIRFFVDNCPQALKFYQEGKPQSTEHFDVGVAAHAVRQVVGEKNARDRKMQERIGDAVVKELITTGRKYYDEPRPPMQPEHAMAGRDLALQYLAEHPLPEKAKYETVLAMDKKGNPCSADDPDIRWRAIIDCFYPDVEGDEEFAYNVIVVDDWKSSWSAGENELETLQRKSQAVLAGLHFPHMQGVRVQITNIRTGQPFSKTIFFDDAGKELLARWRKDILMLCDAADKTTAARPGAGCKTCPFINSCPDAEKLSASAKNAEALAVLNSKREKLVSLLKSQLDEYDGIRLADGYIGYKNLPASTLSDEAPYQILGMWFDKPLDDVPHVMPKEVGLLRAMKPGVTQVENIAKQLFNGDGKTAREDFIKLCVKPSSRREFGVWPASKQELDAMHLLAANGKLPRAKKKAAKKTKKSKSKKAA